MMMKILIQSVIFSLIAVLLSTAGDVKVIYAKVGDKVTLTKPSHKKLDNPYVYWDFDSNLRIASLNSMGGTMYIQAEPWKNKLALSGGSLTINNIQAGNFGTFFCTLTSGLQTVSKTEYKIIQINVSANPAAPLLPGEHLSLSCKVQTPPSAKPSIHWLNPLGDRVKDNKETFTITATNQHNGQWMCVVTHDKTEYKYPISVTVVGLAPAPSHLYTSANSRLTIPCSIPSSMSWKEVNSTGVQEVQWHFLPKSSQSHTSDNRQRLFHLSLGDKLTWKTDDGRGLQHTDSDVMKGNLSLYRNKGRKEDRGNYTCSITFKNGMILQRTMSVEVLQIFPSPGTQLISGQQLNLTCSTGNPLPSDVQLKWFPPQESSIPMPDPHRAHLNNLEVGVSDSGMWRCELWQNSKCLTSAMITLKIEPKLSVWMLVIIGSAAVIILLLLVLTFILYRRRQRKTRYPRHRLCQCKNPKPKGFYRTT
ncbi:CD4-1 molecule [Pholidichthys leucotaenia]